MAETTVIDGPLTVTGPLTAPKAVGVEAASNSSGVVNALRVRVATGAPLVAGITVLPALPGLRYRLHHAALIAIGGAATGGTSVSVLGTRGGSAQLFTALIAALTQDTYVAIGAANTSIQAAGASFVACDVNTPVVAASTGTIATATNIDVLLVYSIHR